MAALVAVGLLSGCGLLGGSDAPPPEARAGADRLAPAGSIAGDRRPALHDADGAPLDESRGQAVGSIVPRDSGPKDPPPLPGERPADSQM
ncbi:MAG: hypothetical protein KF889_18345 [Alphaproteobacteria bacterium]|nr:hypothetical protein [Alphaproteobacteria bacterium]MCW5743972.1 hypothetical protein [Alphaproteobacteria bacterium]